MSREDRTSAEPATRAERDRQGAAPADAASARVRVVLPEHLRNLARVQGEVVVEVEGDVTLRSTLDALEARLPVLRGAIRERGTQQRRAFVRFFAVRRDLSHDPPDMRLPDEVVSGMEPFVVVGAMAGG